MNSTLPIPDRGLAEVLSSWTGRGAIWAALAAAQDVAEERDWTARDIAARAHRVLLERLVPALGGWPSRVTAWIDYLPATRAHARTVRDVPFSGVSWAATRARFGWPPSAFEGRETERHADMLLATTLRWTVEQLVQVRADAVRAYPDVDLPIRAQLDAAAALLSVEPVRSAVPVAPRKPELTALRSEGAPWIAVANVANELRLLDSSIDILARHTLMPDEGIQWRLFHLAVLGELLMSLRQQGWKVMSRRPIAAWVTGPAYVMNDPDGKAWELWFEAAGIWSSLGIPSPYVQATKGVVGAGRALGADLLLIRPGETALILECKYSASGEVVGRDGYLQATAYAAEAMSLLADEVTAVVIGPSSVVSGLHVVDGAAGRVGVAPPDALPQIIGELGRRTVAKVDAA